MRCGVDHALQDRLQVELGAADDAQQLGRCSPLRQSLFALAGEPRDLRFSADSERTLRPAAFDVRGALRASALRRRTFTGSPSPLERRRIAAPRLRTRHRGEVRLARWSMVRHNLRGPIFA